MRPRYLAAVGFALFWTISVYKQIFISVDQSNVFIRPLGIRVTALHYAVTLIHTLATLWNQANAAYRSRLSKRSPVRTTQLLNAIIKLISLFLQVTCVK